MTRRRGRRNHGQAKPGPGAPESPAPVVSPRGGVAGDQARTSIPAVLRATLERAAEMAKTALGSHGKAAAMAVFAYKSEPGQGEGDGADEFKTVSLAWRTELQRETIKRRIREKAAAEGASAVVILTGAGTEGSRAKKAPSQEKGVLFFSGAMPNARASARVSYVLEREAKAVTSWEMRISAEPGEAFFLEGIFAASKTRQ